jgi:hypothetical protein
MSRLIGGGQKSRLIGGDLGGLLSGKIPVVVPVYLRRLLISNKGLMIVRSIEIVRVPIERKYAVLMDIISRGKIPENMTRLNYDDLYHIYCVLTLANGETYLTEKNERVKFVKGSVSGQDSIGPFAVNKTLRQLFKNVEEYAGGWEKLVIYNPSTPNTCQQYATALAAGAGVMTYSTRRFIRQNLPSVMADSPKTSKLISAVISAVGIGISVLDEIFDDVQTLSGQV